MTKSNSKENLNKVNMQNIFDKTQYVDICNYHNQTIDFLDEVKKQTDYFPKKLINFDMHSDMRINYDEEFVCVFNWVTFALQKYGIEEYYWVFPQSVFSNKDMFDFTFHNQTRLKRGRAFYGNFTQNQYEYSKEQPLVQTFIYDCEKNIVLGESPSLPPDEFSKQITENKNYRPIKIYICSEENLPNFANEDVIVSVDGDYFANNGFDTTFDFSYNPEDIEKDFNRFLKCLKEKQISPLYLSLCISPNYSLKIDEIENFFKLVKNNCINSISCEFEHIHTDVRHDNYEYCVVFFDKIEGEISFFDVGRVCRDLGKDFALNILQEKYNDIKDGTYFFSFYVKDFTNPDTGETYIKLYPDEQIVDTYQKPTSYKTY